MVRLFGPRHIVVIGGGIIGVSCALHLQAAGHDVTLIDAQDPGEGASKGNAGVLAIDSCLPLGAPDLIWKVPGMLLDPLGPLAIRWRYFPWLMPWLYRMWRASRPVVYEELARALRTLLVNAKGGYAPFLVEPSVSSLLRESGWLAVYQSEKKFADAQGDLALQRKMGVPMEVLDTGGIRRIEPSLAPGFRHAVYYPENMHVLDSFDFVRSLVQLFLKRGGLIVRDRITHFGFSNVMPAQAVSGQGRYEFDAVVIAAGAWSRSLARCLRYDPPLDTERGYHVMLSRPGLQPRLPIYSGDWGFVATPMRDGLRFAGTVEFGGLKAPANFARAQILLERGKMLFPDVNIEQRSEWMGFRPSLPDSVPIISGSAHHRNVFFAFGHGHLGLTLGGVTGRLIADLVGERDPGFDIGPYSIDRFQA